MKAKNKIVRLRKKFPLLPSNQIAQQVGVSRQYVSIILQKNSLPTSAPRRKNLKDCPQCHFLHRGRGKFCSAECHFRYTQIAVSCAFCHLKFYRTRQLIDTKARLGYHQIYCSRTCYYRGQRDGLNNAY